MDVLQTRWYVEFPEFGQIPGFLAFPSTPKYNMLIMISLRGTVTPSTACIRRIVDVKIRGCMRNEGAFDIRVRFSDATHQ